MKNKTLCLWVLIIAFVVGSISSPAWAKELKIGYIDVSKVFDEYKKTKDSDKSLEKETKVKQEERDKLVSEVRRMRDELDLLSEKGRRQKQTEIDKKVDSLKAFDRETARELTKKRNEMVASILKEIDDTVKAHAKAQGYDFVLNDGVLLYKQDSMNITDGILKTLNKKYKR